MHEYHIIVLPVNNSVVWCTGFWATFNRPESNFHQKAFRMSQNIHLICSSVFPLCLHYAPRLTTFLAFILEHFNMRMLY